MASFQLGLLVNPVAGMGGSVGLKGTDGGLADAARARGAAPIAPARAAAALSQLSELGGVLRIHACSGEMGENAVKAAGLDADIVTVAAARSTTAADTRAAVREFERRGVDLLMFAGGDGTARDILAALGRATPVLGIPAGVKMHSAVFAPTPRTAGEVARLYVASADRAELLQEAEIMDREGDGDRPASPRLYGVLRTPRVSFYVPRAKASAPADEAASLDSALRRVAQLAGDDRISLVGPGTTMQKLKSMLGVDGSPLGVAIVHRGRCIDADASETRILEAIAGKPARIVVSIVGGQGFLFGRGNQQLSAQVIRQVGRENIVVVSSLEKLASLAGTPLYVDTGDDALDAALSGHLKVITGMNRSVVVPVGNPVCAAVADCASPRGSGGQ